MFPFLPPKLGWIHRFGTLNPEKLYIHRAAAVSAAKLLQSCLTLCDPIDSSPPGSPVPGILQARTLEWVAISFSNAWKWKVKVKSLSHVRLFATPWTAAHQALLCMGFSRQEYWRGVPSPSPIQKANYILYLIFDCMGVSSPNLIIQGSSVCIQGSS